MRRFIVPQQKEAWRIVEVVPPDATFSSIHHGMPAACCDIINHDMHQLEFAYIWLKLVLGFLFDKYVCCSTT